MSVNIHAAQTLVQAQRRKSFFPASASILRSSPGAEGVWETATPGQDTGSMPQSNERLGEYNGDASNTVGGFCGGVLIYDDLPHVDVPSAKARVRQGLQPPRPTHRNA
ncbi:hypothetical protein CIB48_g12089 [Xylaria polymorpha]|nr:hypothetical protein CIB48_g12089 [Xylaria polymorpha]